MSIEWFAVIGLAIGAVGLRALRSTERREADLGWMSQQWLREYRAGGR